MAGNDDYADHGAVAFAAWRAEVYSIEARLRGGIGSIEAQFRAFFLDLRHYADRMGLDSIDRQFEETLASYVSEVRDNGKVARHDAEPPVTVSFATTEEPEDESLPVVPVVPPVPEMGRVYVGSGGVQLSATDWTTVQQVAATPINWGSGVDPATQSRYRIMRRTLANGSYQYETVRVGMEAAAIQRGFHFGPGCEFGSFADALTYMRHLPRESSLLPRTVDGAVPVPPGAVHSRLRVVRRVDADGVTRNYFQQIPDGEEA